MREQMIQTLKQHAKANSQLHCMNIEVYLKKPAGIREPSDIMEAIQAELDKMAMHADRLDILDNYFNE